MPLFWKIFFREWTIVKSNERNFGILRPAEPAWNQAGAGFGWMFLHSQPSQVMAEISSLSFSSFNKSFFSYFLGISLKKKLFLKNFNNQRDFQQMSAFWAQPSRPETRPGLGMAENAAKKIRPRQIANRAPFFCLKSRTVTVGCKHFSENHRKRYGKVRFVTVRVTNSDALL